MGQNLRHIGLCIGLAATAGAGTAVWAETPPWVDPAIGIELIAISGGCFELGHDTPGKVDGKGFPNPPRADEMPRHEVCVGDFWIGRHEVTVDQWERVTGPAATAVPADARQRPVATVSYEQVQEFIASLNQTGRSPSGQAGRYRLPTEAEWEYACRAGQADRVIVETTIESRAELARVALFRSLGVEDPSTSPVGSLAANAWGLYDMLGNVWEWTLDTYAPDAYARHELHDPRHVDDSGRQVIRGGSFKSDDWQIRCGVRNYGLLSDPLPTVGFRVTWVPAS